MSLGSDTIIRLAIFASGNGSNAEALIQYFQHHSNIRVVAVFVNKPGAGVIEKAKKLNVPVVLFGKEEWQNGSVLKQLHQYRISYILLAGFFWLVPIEILRDYENKILNIHPSLLPKYGGKGMYGIRVHEAVLANNERESGITIHLINEAYDDGEILFQKKIQIEPSDTALTLAHKINQLETYYYPRITEAFILNLKMY
jgi:phosphoribosylglycinamide formyltransferase-1